MEEVQCDLRVDHPGQQGTHGSTQGKLEGEARAGKAAGSRDPRVLLFILQGTRESERRVLLGQHLIIPPSVQICNASERASER